MAAISGSNKFALLVMVSQSVGVGERDRIFCSHSSGQHSVTQPELVSEAERYSSGLAVMGAVLTALVEEIKNDFLGGKSNMPDWPPRLHPRSCAPLNKEEKVDSAWVQT